MATAGDAFGGIGSVVGGIGSFIGGQQRADAFEAEAGGFDTAAMYALMNTSLVGEVGGLQELAASRKIQATQGTQQAIASANGLKISGSAYNLIRDATQQGYLTEGQIGLNTAIQTANYEAQSESYKGQAAAARAQAEAARTSGTFGLLGGILGGIGKLFLL